MPIPITELASRIVPEQTVLFFGAGSSAASGAPGGRDLTNLISDRFKVSHDYSLSETAMLAESKAGRKELIDFIRLHIASKTPTGGLLNLPRNRWKSIYTTNYDTLIEQAYSRHGINIEVISSNFDFSIVSNSTDQRLYKIHGTIQNDIVDGHSSRIIITDGDYDNTSDYRERIFRRLSDQLADSHLIIIGYSLSDGDIRQIIDRALAEKAKAAGVGGRISLLMFEEDFDRASLIERRGIEVSFGCVDQFFAQLSAHKIESIVAAPSGDPLALSSRLAASTINIRHALESYPHRFSDMWNGKPATYADITAGFTFARDATDRAVQSLLTGQICNAVVLGASGVGKTTLARQVMLKLLAEGWPVWEHAGGLDLCPKEWVTVANALKQEGRRGALLIDDAHLHIQQLGEFFEATREWEQCPLSLILCAPKNLWAPRTKSPWLNKRCPEETINRLSSKEIESLLNLVEEVVPIKKLVDANFIGYSRSERRRRIEVKSQSDTFVCLRNIYSSERFDDIIVREFNQLKPEISEVYRTISALQFAGVKVHRQLVVRVLGVPAQSISAVLQELDEIVFEYDIDRKGGIYGWSTRHEVIAGIVSKYKFNIAEEKRRLFENVIDGLSPTYGIEISAMRELCSTDSGILSLPDKKIQNALFRRVISVIPGERVPRHRLIRNLIDMGDFEQAATEIRLFEKDFRLDAPVARFTVMLELERARNTPGLLVEDRKVVLETAIAKSEAYASRFPQSYKLLGAYCEVGIEWLKLSGDHSVFDRAIQLLRQAEVEVGDTAINQLIRSLEARVAGRTLAVDSARHG